MLTKTQTLVRAYKVDDWPPNGVRISDTSGEDPFICYSVPEILHALTEELEPPIGPSDYKSATRAQVWRFFFHLDRDLSPILRAFGREACELLSEDPHRWEYRYSDQNGDHVFSVYYMKGRVFSVENKNRRYTARYFGLEPFLQEAPDTPMPVDEAHEYAASILEAYKEFGCYQIESFSSPIRAYQKYFDHWVTPSPANMPPEALDAAWCNAEGKEWRECHAVGHFPQIWDYDLTNAYGRILMNLPDMSQPKCGKWYHLATNKLPPREAFGYFRCHIFIKEGVAVSPIVLRITRGDNHTSHNPTGHFEEWLNLAEVYWIRDHDLGTVDILDGYFFYPSKIVKPLEVPLQRLIQIRQQLRQQGKGLASFLLKKTVAGIYGKFLEQWDNNKVGPKFYPPWGAEAVIQTKLAVADFLYKHQVATPIHVSTDGCMLSAPIELSPEDIKKGWRLSYTGPGLVLSTGNVFYSDRKPQGLYLDDALRLIQADPRANVWSKIIPRRATLAEALATDLDLLGRFIETHTTLNLRPDHKRIWRKFPRDGQQLLSGRQFHSRPRHYLNTVIGGPYE